MEEIEESTVPVPSDSNFNVEDVVLAFHGHLLYEARVLDVVYEDEDDDELMEDSTQRRVKAYSVHYQGWKKAWEETVPRELVFEHNDENLRVAHRLLNGAKLRQQALQPADSGCLDGEHKVAGTSVPATPTASNQLFIFPAALQRQIVDDWEFITKDNRLVTLPRNPSVVDILNKWVANKRPTGDRGIKEMADSLQTYFDACLPRILLFRFERKQYSDYFITGETAPNNNHSKQASPNQPPSPSSVYGAEHLLRLILKLPYMLECSSVERSRMISVSEKVNDLTRYLQKNGRLIFLTEYPQAPKSYIRQAMSSE